MKFYAYLSLILLMSCDANKPTQNYNEVWRPRFHFTPEKNWINDPNGLVYHDGEYHLFYQYNPYGDTWGHMSWGHAVSADLLQWHHLPVALEEYTDPASGDSTMIFSGTAVVDRGNTSGLCQSNECLVAIYTSHVHRNNEGLRQHQSLAYSNDNGRTWKRYDKNPILDIERKDFRDPKVFWYEPEKKWIMALVVPDLFKVQFYESANLLSWKLMSEFGGVGDQLRIWECPDLYPIAVEEESGKQKWVLSLSGSHPSGPQFVGMQYFVGEFDGRAFTLDSLQKPHYLEYGKDFYAGIVYNNLPGNPIMVGWLNNWTYGNQLPTNPWRGAMSVPRELQLKKIQDQYRLIQNPIPAFTQLRGTAIADIESFDGGSLEIELEVNRTPGELLHLFSFEGKRVTLGLEQDSIYLDRQHSGNVEFNKDFPSIDRAPILSEGSVKLRVLIDQSVIEVFVNDGEAAITSLAFPRHRNKMHIVNRANIKSIQAWEIRSTWQNFD